MSTIDRIGALLAKAEATDNEHEREAYISKAQQLATVSAISLEAARQRQSNKTRREAPIVKRISLFDISDRSRTRAHFVELFMAIGAQNDLRFGIMHKNMGVVATGFPSDIEVVELMYNSLAVQMSVAADAYLKTGDYKNESAVYERRDRWGYGSDFVRKPMDGRTARKNFYDGFISAISKRLRQAREEAEALAVSEDADVEVESLVSDGGTSSALVLATKRDEVDQAYAAERRNYKGSWSGTGRRSGYSASASSAGTAAGNRARLGTARGIGNGGGRLTA